MCLLCDDCMKISIHTTITNPKRWQFPYMAALASFCDVADEVIVVDGGSTDGSIEEIEKLSFDRGNKIKIVPLPWPDEYTNSELPKHLNAGLVACTGDWAIKTDIDYVFHEKDITDLQVRLRAFHKEHWMAASMEKLLVINKSRAFRKSKMPFIIHKSDVGDAVQYGIQMDVDPALDDWCYPIIPLRGKMNKEGVPMGSSLPIAGVKATGIDVWNYDYFFRTKEQAKECFARTAAARRKSAGNEWGANDEDSWKLFLQQTEGRMQKVFIPLEVKSHPKYIRDAVASLRPEQYGHSNWGMCKQ